MIYSELKECISSTQLDDKLKKIYCIDNLTEIKKRYLDLLEEAYATYGDGDYHFISSPGRSEIGGNHTDHQHGHVLAASINIDNLAIVKANDSNTINYKDKAFAPLKVELDDLSIHEDEINTSAALIRGIAARLDQLGYKTGGFDGLCDSHVLIGSGISSSACFEVMITEIFSSLYNDDRIDPVERALTSQYAENVYFGKPSGLMDQTSISVGGFVAIDFKDPSKPVIENHDFSFSDHGYELVLIDTKGDHSDLSHEYSAITSEIKKVALELGVEYLADSSLEKLMDNLKTIRDNVANDRAVLRSIHFYLEDQRAIRQTDAVKNNDIDTLISLMKDSGRSSYEYLQNANISGNHESQSICVGLAAADTVLLDEGVCRVHGGGFEGTIQLVVPQNKLAEIRKVMSSLFGDDCIMELKVRPVGTCLVI